MQSITIFMPYKFVKQCKFSSIIPQMIPIVTISSWPKIYVFFKQRLLITPKYIYNLSHHCQRNPQNKLGILGINMDINIPQQLQTTINYLSSIHYNLYLSLIGPRVYPRGSLVIAIVRLWSVVCGSSVFKYLRACPLVF